MNTGTTDGQIRLRSLVMEDTVAIENWPTYSAEFADLDYALRKHGWIAEFRDQPGTWLYAAEQYGELVGFSLLVTTDEQVAEFRIALHPDKVGKGLGKLITLETLRRGFEEIQLKRIHLIVRKNNLRAIQLYQRINFSICGECRKIVNNTQSAFLIMDIVRFGFPPDRTTSHSTKLANNASKVAGYTRDNQRLASSLA